MTREKGRWKDKAVVRGKAEVKPKPDVKPQADVKPKNMIEEFLAEYGYTKADIHTTKDMGNQWKLIMWDAKKYIVDKEE